MAQEKRPAKANPVPSLVSLGDETDDQTLRSVITTPARDTKECVQLWSRLGNHELQCHERVIKINALAPFLFGSNDPGLISEEWIDLGYELGMLISTIVLPSNVERMDKAHLDAAELIDKACDLVIRDKNRVGAILEINEDLKGEKGSLQERLRSLDDSSIVSRWRLQFLRDQLEKEAKASELGSINEAKVLFAIAFVIRHYANHIILFTTNKQNLREEFEDEYASGENATMEKDKIKGNNYFRDKNYRHAVQSYSRALSQSRYSHILYGNRAQAYLCLELYDQALCDSYRAIILKPDWPKGHYRYVEALIKLKRVPAAVRANAIGRQKCPNDKMLQAQHETMSFQGKRAKNPSTTQVNTNASVPDKSERVFYDSDEEQMLINSKMDKKNSERAPSLEKRLEKVSKAAKFSVETDGDKAKVNGKADKKSIERVLSPGKLPEKVSKSARIDARLNEATRQDMFMRGYREAARDDKALSKKMKSGKGKSVDNRAESRTRTDSSSGSVQAPGSKSRKKSDAKTQESDPEDVPDLVSDEDNEEDSDSDEDYASDNDCDANPIVKDVIDRWDRGLKKKKSSVEKKYEKPSREDEFKMVLVQASEALMASLQGASQAGVAAENYHQAVLMLHNHPDQDSLGNQGSDIEINLKSKDVILYCMGVAYVLKGRDADICRGIELFEKIMTEQFPLAYLGLGRAFLQQNRYEKAIQPAREGLKVVEKHPVVELNYPETSTVIEETRPGKLKIELQSLLQAAQFPPKPDAVCRYSDCSGHYKIYIYFSDPDFKGFVRVVCYSKCMIEFHHECWKKFKSSQADRSSDKDIANGECFTPDCHSPVWKIVFINEAREVIKEILGNEQVNAAIDAPAKKVLKMPASSARALKRKAEKKALRKQRQKEKDNNNEQRDVVLSKESKENGNISGKHGTQGGSTGQTDGANSSLPKIEDLTMLKKDESSPSSNFMIKGKQSQKSKKLKKKGQGKVVMTLGEFTSVHGEGEEEVVTPEPVAVPPKSSMGLDDFSDYGSAESRFPLLDPKRPFSVPSDIEEEIRSFEISYSGLPTPPVGSPGPMVLPSGGGLSNNPSFIRRDSTPSSGPSFNANSSSGVSLDSESVDKTEGIKETIYCVFASLLEETGPLHIYDKRIMEELENFPQPAMDLIQKSGNVGRFLIQSLKFAMIDDFVCLMQDAVKARDLSDGYKEGLNRGKTPLAPPPVVKLSLTEQDFPAIGAMVLDNKPPRTKASELASEVKIAEGSSVNNLTDSVSDLMNKARTLARNIASSPTPPPTSAVTFTPTFTPSVPPGFVPSAPTAAPSSPFSAPLYSGATETLSTMKWDSIQVFSGPPQSPLPSSFPFVPNVTPPNNERGPKLDIGESPSTKSPGVIGSGTPTRNRVDLTDVSPEISGPPYSRMFSLWQRGAGDAPSSPLPEAASSVADPPSSMLDDVDDDEGPILAPPPSSYNIWSQGEAAPLPGSQLPRFPTYPSWDVPKSTLFDNPITSAQDQVAASDRELVDDITKSVTDELKDSPFVRFNNMDISANIKADILNDLEKGVELRRARDNSVTSNAVKLPPRMCDTGVNTTPDNFLTAYGEMHKQLETKTEELSKVKEMLQEAVRRTEIYAAEIEDLKNKNMTLEENQVLRESEQQTIQVALQVEKHQHESYKAAMGQRMQAVHDKFNESESNNKELQAQIEHLIGEHQRQHARIKELEEKNADLESRLVSATETGHFQEERAKTSEISLLKLKSDVGSEVLERSLKDAQSHVDNLSKSKSRWTDLGESVPHVLIQGIEQWENTIRSIKRKAVESKLEFEEQMTKVKEGVPMSSLPLLSIPRPPPPPDANMIRDILVLLHRKASPPPSGVSTPPPTAPSGVNPAITRPPGFSGLKPARPTTPPVGKAPGAPKGPSVAMIVGNSQPTIPKFPPGLGVTPVEPPRQNTSPVAWGAIAAPSGATASAPQSSGGTWSTVISKKTLNKVPVTKGGSFTKIMALLEQLFPDIPSERLHSYIQDVRTSRGGSLSGLSINEVINLTSEHIFKKQPSAKPAMPLGGAAASGLSNFGGASRGGATASRGDIYEEEDPCPICHEELSNGPVSPLECGHKFHDDCIRKWFREQSTCPTCRVHALLPDDFPRLG